MDFVYAESPELVGVAAPVSNVFYCAIPLMVFVRYQQLILIAQQQQPASGYFGSKRHQRCNRLDELIHKITLYQGRGYARQILVAALAF